MNDFFTTSYLGSYAGLMAVTFLLVQFFKEPIKNKLSDWWVRLLAVFFAFCIQMFMLFVIGNFTLESIGLAFLNSFLIATAAAGTYDMSKSIFTVTPPTTTEPTIIPYNPIYDNGRVEPPPSQE